MPGYSGGGGGGTGDALTTNPLSQFAATTAAQLRSVVSDANTLLLGYATTATAAGTTTLTATSKNIQYFTGTTTQTITLPVTSTLALGWQFRITNLSTGALTINSSGANLIATVPSKMSLLVTCILTSGTTAASWNAELGGIGDTGTATHVLTSNGPGTLPTFQAAAGGGGVDVQEFTASGTWTKPANATWCYGVLIGGGGGGGSGRRGAAGTDRTGGGGGGSGGVMFFQLPASSFGATETIAIGAGGAGGAAQTVDDTDGNAGASGGVSSIGTLIVSYSPAGGGGGNATQADYGAGGGCVVFPLDYTGVDVVNDGSASVPSGGSTPANVTTPTPTGGGGGGSITSGNAGSAGGAGGGVGLLNGAVFAGGTGGAAGANNGMAGAVALGIHGRGGGGGGGNSAGAGGAGGNGANYGGGGGGGGASVNGSDSGAGGDGGDGYCIIYTMTEA